MKFYFIDTNIILDLLADRKPFSKNAEHLFVLAEEKKIRLYCSIISFNNIYYILKKELGHKKTIPILNLLKQQVHIIDFDKNILLKAMDSDFQDFEDAIQHFSALTNQNIECIVTRNEKDYKHSNLLILTPDLALYRLLSE
ncbi:MAG: PIN domain-containing protein [Flavobacteriia bacterium]|nr:PIN domain-containing protein [Flavobacteriia bacterium]